MIVNIRLFVVFLFLFSACSQKQSRKTSPVDSSYFFDPISLGALNEKSNLTITARFSECGEWGGHKETITVYSDKERTFYATYKVYPYNCDSLDYYYANDSLKPILNKETTLTDSHKKSIVDYIQRMVKSKATETVIPSHAGNYFSVINSDSSFLIEVFDTKEFDISSFRQLTTAIIK